MSVEIYDPGDLENFRKVQSLAYSAAERTAEKLRPGVTEKQAAHMLEEHLKNAGIRHFFHHSFAWFGDRTRFLGFQRPPSVAGLLEGLNSFLNVNLPHFGGQFQPSDRRLEEGMPFILDVAPVSGVYSADIGYSGCLGKNPDVEQGIQDLKNFRPLILEGVLAEKSLSRIYDEVDELISDLGYENIHSFYPGSVLGHKVGKIPFMNIPAVTVLGFDWQTVAYLSGQAASGIISGGFSTPLWGPSHEGRAEPGLWAMEPHIGREDFGVKWEEILVVTESDARWLSDDLPHVKRWQSLSFASV